VEEPVGPLLDEDDAAVEQFEVGEGVDDLVLVLDVDFEGVVVVAEVD
jgi:hypothetical protein